MNLFHLFKAKSKKKSGGRRKPVLADREEELLQKTIDEHWAQAFAIEHNPNEIQAGRGGLIFQKTSQFTFA